MDSCRVRLVSNLLVLLVLNTVWFTCGVTGVPCALSLACFELEPYPLPLVGAPVPLSLACFEHARQRMTEFIENFPLSLACFEL